MAAIYSVTQADIALAAATLKSLLEISVPTNKRARLVQWSIEFDSVTATAVPVLVDIARRSVTMTGTAATAQPWDEADGTSGLTVKHTSTAEGAGTTTVLDQHRVPPTSGMLVQYPLGREIVIGASGFLRLRATAPAPVNATVTMVWEE